MNKTIVVILVLVVAPIMFWAVMFFGPGGTVDQKATYAEMQGVEHYYRDKKLITPFVLESENGLSLVAVESGDKNFPYAWLDLTLDNREDADGVFRVGSAPWKLTCEQVKGLLATQKISEKVSEFLTHHCNAK